MLTSRDRLELAFAWEAASTTGVAAVGVTVERDGDTPKSLVGAWVEADIATVRRAADGGVHPQIALRNSLLAHIAGMEGSKRRRGRRLREVDRSRVLIGESVLADVQLKLADERYLRSGRTS